MVKKTVSGTQPAVVVCYMILFLENKVNAQKGRKEKELVIRGPNLYHKFPDS